MSAGVLEALLDAASDALLAVDPDGTIVFANRRAGEVFATPAGELLGASAADLISTWWTTRDDAPRPPSEVRSGPRSTAGEPEAWARRSDGTQLRVQVRLQAVASEQGRLVAASLREAAPEDAVARAEPGQERVLHDFNNLLSVIVNYATLAERETTDPSVIADIGQIRIAAERATALAAQVAAPTVSTDPTISGWDPLDG